MIKRFILIVLISEGFFSFPLNLSWSESIEPQAADQIQKLSQQSQKLREEYKTKKKALEAQLQQELKTLTDSPSGRLRRRQWMQETNERLRQLQEDFNLEMDSLQEAKNKLIHPDAPAFVRSAPRPRAISDEELKARIKRQDELFSKGQERGNAAENNPQPPAVSVENSPHENPPPVLFPPAPPFDQEPSKKSNGNAY